MTRPLGAALLQLLEGCDCGAARPGDLVALVDGRRLCLREWRAAGRPFPRRAASADDVQTAEAETRQRMLKRGGAHAHLVTKGLT